MKNIIVDILYKIVVFIMLFMIISICTPFFVLGIVSYGAWKLWYSYKDRGELYE
jgi:hypothetical protein